jgi:steroid 5-alpha reductase family enzyme
MIATLAVRIGLAWAVCALTQAILWRVAQRTRNAGIVDVGWALTFTAVVVVYAALAIAPVAAWLPIALVVTAWSLRLGAYLIARGAATGPEEGRYADLRERWHPHAERRFFAFFQAQAALTAILSLAFVVPFVAAPWDGGWLRALGASVSVIGVAGEALADAQLRRWKRDLSHRGQVCEVGLWSVSRHPNYFFEWCVWIGHAVYGLAFAPWGLVALVGQAIILGSIFGVTGIPPTENQALRSKGDAYRQYQARVSRFIPMPPKSPGRRV